MCTPKFLLHKKFQILETRKRTLSFPSLIVRQKNKAQKGEVTHTELALSDTGESLNF